MKTARAVPRSFASQMSDINALKMHRIKIQPCHGEYRYSTHPELANGAAANAPPRKRKIKIDAVFCDNAEPT